MATFTHDEVFSEPLTLGKTPLVELEQGSFGKLLDTVTGGQSVPENLMQLPVGEVSQGDAAIGGVARGMIPFIEPAVAALDTLPFGREIEGRPDISAGDLFTVGLDQARRRREKQRNQFFGTSLTGEIAGALPAGFGVAKLPFVANALPKSPVLTSGGIGAAFGGLTAASQAESIEDVPSDLLKGGAIGGIAGVGFGAVADRVLAPATKAIFNTLQSSKAQSNNMLSKFMRDIFPDEKAAQTVASQLSPEGVPLDISGGTRQLGQTLATKSPRFGQRAAETLIQRGKGAVDRVTKVTNKILGTRGKSVANTLTDLQSKRLKEFTNIIDDVYQQPVDQDKVQNLIGQIDDAIERTQGVKGFSTNLKQLKRSLFKDPKQTILKDSHETLHLARKAYGDVVNKAGSGAKGLLSEIRDNFDDVFPSDFKRANSIWSTSKKTEEAMQLGRKVLRDDADITIEAIGRMPQAEKEGYLIGVARAIDDAVKTPQEGAKITGVFNKPIVKDRLRAVMPDDDIFNEFMSKVGTENTFNLTKNAILSGSQTHEKQAAEKLFEAKAAEFGADVKSGAVRRMMDWLLGAKRDKTLNVSDDVIDALGDTLLTQGKVTPEFISQMMKTPLREHVNSAINTAIGPGAAVSSEQAADITLRNLPE